MLQYVNHYYGALNSERNEVILSFYQESPSPSIERLHTSGTKTVAPENISTVEVGNFVMSREGAQTLLSMLQGLLQQDSTNNSEK